MTQYAPSVEKDLTNARTQNVLSSSNMAKPIKSSSRKTGMVMCSIKVVEDAPSLFSCVARKYMEFLPHLLEVLVYHVGIRILAKRKEKFPYPPLSNNLFKGTQI